MQHGLFLTYHILGSMTVIFIIFTENKCNIHRTLEWDLFETKVRIIKSPHFIDLIAVTKLGLTYTLSGWFSLPFEMGKTDFHLRVQCLLLWGIIQKMRRSSLLSFSISPERLGSPFFHLGRPLGELWKNCIFLCFFSPGELPFLAFHVCNLRE